uniref:Uncharacterized protein n=1 Tax=Brassica oleracea var. oleracea TaxID=109376 RepID=A0A0D2ZXB1_BRAOL
MASSDIVLVHSTFDALLLGRSAQTIGCRRLHFWTRKTSRSKVNSWELLYSSFMRRNRRYMGSFLLVEPLITIRLYEQVQS